MVALKISARILGSLLCIALPGCSHAAKPKAAPRVAGAEADWRRIATPADRSRLRQWRQAWIDALAKVRDGGEAGTLSGDAALFDPDRALGSAMPPAGPYRCRVFKLGANGTAMRNVTPYPAVDCKVANEGDVSSLYKVSGGQRPVGLLFRDSDARAIFLGTLVLGDETKPLDYGQDATRDLAGYVERIGPQRWRLVLPYPRFESLLDVVEIVPASRR